MADPLKKFGGVTVKASTDKSQTQVSTGSPWFVVAAIAGGWWLLVGLILAAIAHGLGSDALEAVRIGAFGGSGAALLIFTIVIGNSRRK